MSSSPPLEGADDPRIDPSSTPAQLAAASTSDAPAFGASGLEPAMAMETVAPGLEGDDPDEPVLEPDSPSSSETARSIPTFDRFIEPVLRVLERHVDGLSAADAYEAAADAVGLTPEQRAAVVPSGQQPIYKNRIGWAHDRLKRCGYSTSPRRGYWALTPQGRAFAAEQSSPFADELVRRISETAKDKRLRPKPAPGVASASAELDDGGASVEGLGGDDDEFGEVTHPYDPSKNNIVTKQLSLDLLLRRLRHDEIDLMPDFQRKGNLWSDERMSRLIESILIRIPLPVLYFDATDDAKWLVVDGLQRLSTLKRFVIDQSLVLTRLEYLRAHEGKRFSELPRDLQRRIEETQVTAHLIEPGTPLEVKYNIFRRINTGGIVLTAQEIRHALNPGPVAKLLAELASSPELVETTLGSVPTDRMLDRELVLRFCAFYRTPLESYQGNMDLFLTQQMRELNRAPAEHHDELRQAFLAALTAARELFGVHAFRKRYQRDDRRKPINKALFEAWTVTLARLDPERRARLVSARELVVDGFITLMGNFDFDQAITQGTGDVRRVLTRFRGVSDLVEGVLARSPS